MNLSLITFTEGLMAFITGVAIYTAIEILYLRHRAIRKRKSIINSQAAGEKQS